MKKKLSFILAVLLIIACLTGCGGTKASDMANTGGGFYDGAKGESMPSEVPSADGDFSYVTDSADSPALLAGVQVDMTKKIIYTAHADIETIDFEGSVEKVYELLEQHNAFLENSYVTGKSYSTEFYGHQSYRVAEFVIRVPREHYSALTANLNMLGNVLSVNSSMQNITTQYIDTESRLETYRIEEDRLLAMLEKAATVEEMITIESRLSDVRYNIESLTSQLKNWDNEVDFSTVTVYINEVRELTEQLPVQRTYWEEIGDGLKSTLKDTGRFFKNLLKFIIVNAPVLIIIAAVLIVSILLALKAPKVKKTKKNANTEDTEKTE